MKLGDIKKIEKDHNQDPAILLIQDVIGLLAKDPADLYDEASGKYIINQRDFYDSYIRDTSIDITDRVMERLCKIRDKFQFGKVKDFFINPERTYTADELSWLPKRIEMSFSISSKFKQDPNIFIDMVPTNNRCSVFVRCPLPHFVDSKMFSECSAVTIKLDGLESFKGFPNKITGRLHLSNTTPNYNLSLDGFPSVINASRGQITFHLSGFVQANDLMMLTKHLKKLSINNLSVDGRFLKNIAYIKRLENGGNEIFLDVQGQFFETEDGRKISSVEATSIINKAISEHENFVDLQAALEEALEPFGLSHLA